jgi:hypothetical protein
LASFSKTAVLSSSVSGRIAGRNWAGKFGQMERTKGAIKLNAFWRLSRNLNTPMSAPSFSSFPPSFASFPDLEATTSKRADDTTQSKRSKEESKHKSRYEDNSSAVQDSSRKHKRSSREVDDERRSHRRRGEADAKERVKSHKRDRKSHNNREPDSHRRHRKTRHERSVEREPRRDAHMKLDVPFEDDERVKAQEDWSRKSGSSHADPLDVSKPMFYSDKRGDLLNAQFGRLDAKQIPEYRLAGGASYILLWLFY